MLATRIPSSRPRAEAFAAFGCDAVSLPRRPHPEPRIPRIRAFPMFPAPSTAIRFFSIPGE